MTEITEGAYLRVWPGVRDATANSYAARALTKPTPITSFSTSVDMVRVQYLGGPRAGGTDYIAVTHVEVIEPGSAGVSVCGGLMHPIVVSLGKNGTCPCGQAVGFSGDREPLVSTVREPGVLDLATKNGEHVATISLPEARVSRDVAVAQVEEHADSSWLDAALDAIRDLARTRGRIIADDVWDLLAERKVPAPREPRAMGAVWRKAARLGVVHLASCEHCGTKKVMTTGRGQNSNAMDVPVYRPGRPPAEETPLERAARLSEDARQAIARRDAAIIEAAQGNVFRVVAAATGLAGSTVHNLVKKSKA